MSRPALANLPHKIVPQQQDGTRSVDTYADAPSEDAPIDEDSNRANVMPSTDSRSQPTLIPSTPRKLDNSESPSPFRSPVVQRQPRGLSEPTPAAIPPGVPGSSAASLVSPLSHQSNNRSSSLVIRASGNAKSILYERYQDGIVNGELSTMAIPGKNKNFVCWHEEGKSPNEAFWSCVFVCPLTGECFQSGELIDLADDTALAHRSGKNLNWYKTKQAAMIAAAGRAEDCFSFRELRGRVGRSTIYRYQFCIETPYGYSVLLPGAAPSFPPNLPTEHTDKIKRIQSN